MFREFIVDIDKAKTTLDEVYEWGSSPEHLGPVSKAKEEYNNSLMALVLTGSASGLLDNNVAVNQFVLDKLRIAFEMGYRACSLQNTIR
jgi:hypothetical protein